MKPWEESRLVARLGPVGGKKGAGEPGGAGDPDDSSVMNQEEVELVLYLEPNRHLELEFHDKA